MIIKVLIPVFVFFVVNKTIGQSNFPIKTSAPTSSANEDFLAFDSIFENKKVVCIGESTHGTHEFFTMRHRLFKYLVENHQFNTFFLEADYGTCLRVNRYIHGDTDSIDLVLKSIKLWPWITKEMEDMIEWMRIYNSQNDNRLSFLGCDTQMFVEATNEIDRLILKSNPALLDTNIKLSVPNYYKSRISEDSLLAREIIAHKKEIIPELKLSEKDLSIYNNLIKNLEQIVVTKESKKYYTRDVMMGTNILDHLNKHKDDKIFYWAHNGHIHNNFSTHKKNDKDTLSISAGSFLKRQLKNECLIILQDFSQGSFNSLVLENPDSSILNKRYVMRENTVKYFKEKFLIGNSIDYHSSDIHMVESSYFEDRKRAYIHSIGALFTPNTKRRYAYNFKEESCDWVILHKNTTPTEL